MSVTDAKWELLSNKMVEISRMFNEQKSWQTWTTSGWRIMSNDALRELLNIIKGEDKE